MLPELAKHLSVSAQNLDYLLMLISAVLHVIFAGAVARDVGKLYQLGQAPALVSGSTWAFATLLGGVVTAAIYWFIHHSTLTRPITRDKIHDHRPS